MRLIVCVEDGGGMSFFGRRLSTDRVLLQRILALTEEQPIWMNAYSAGQFAQPADKIRVAEDCLERVGADEWCFAETQDLTPFAGRVNMLVLYRWNRRYPSDRKLPQKLLCRFGEPSSSREFAGFSHERITEEVYCR